MSENRMNKMSMEIHKKALSFIIRDFILQTSYKFEFFLRLFFMFFSILTFYFISKLIGGAGLEYLEPYEEIISPLC